MAEVIRMPRISDTMEEGTIVAWLKEVGDTVEAGDTIAEVETDKATMELDSYVDGVLLHIEVQEGTVPINGVIAVIGEEGEDWKALMNGSNEPQVTKTEEAAPAAPVRRAVPIKKTTTKPARRAVPVKTKAKKKAAPAPKVRSVGKKKAGKKK